MLAGAVVVAVDAVTRTMVPPGRVGELWVSSPSVARGYWGRSEETRVTFENYLTDGTGPFLNTGDLGFLHAGEVFVTGRSKDLIIVRGRNIYPQDVELAVEQALPFIEANACAAFAVEEGGEERIALVIEADRAMVRMVRQAVTAPASLATTVAKVRDAISAAFEATVSKVIFVRPGTFPRTSIR